MATKTRAYVSIGYPESLIDDFVEVLQETHVQTLISPLHDKDIDQNGNIKKEHYHIMIMFDGPKTIEQAQKVFDSISATKCQPVNSVRGQARYLCHLDDPDKAQYDSGQVSCLNGADYWTLIELPSNKYQSIKEMVKWCLDNQTLSFAELFEYSIENNETWFRVLSDNGAYVIKEYLKSKTWTVEQQHITPSRKEDDVDE